MSQGAASRISHVFTSTLFSLRNAFCAIMPSKPLERTARRSARLQARGGDRPGEVVDGTASDIDVPIANAAKKRKRVTKENHDKVDALFYYAGRVPDLLKENHPPSAKDISNGAESISGRKILKNRRSIGIGKSNLTRGLGKSLTNRSRIEKGIASHRAQATSSVSCNSCFLSHSTLEVDGVQSREKIALKELSLLSWRKGAKTTFQMTRFRFKKEGKLVL
ncbi:hypothetical protein SCHPADRAFT_757138 [Schizopora paradoxa]|uniref:Uncharacterized protein n=1 Tax=Schizopora paradoxa TaxID=27342 RepID=A0A0H2QXF5_9AGAM|nr:hypothetical protein SCHPADRAFT_757138 [Schizopora paradoxa]